VHPGRAAFGDAPPLRLDHVLRVLSGLPTGLQDAEALAAARGEQDAT